MAGKAEEIKQIEALAEQVLKLVHDDVLIHLRFFDRALYGLKWRADAQRSYGVVSTDGSVCYYDPTEILKMYQKSPCLVERCYLHVLLHCIFSHNFNCNRLEPRLWNLACDIAVEEVVLELGLPKAELSVDDEMRRKLKILREDAGALTAEKLYRYFRRSPMTDHYLEELECLFVRDIHGLWQPQESLELGEQDWKKISERIKTDIKAFSKGKKGAEILEKNLIEATRDHYNYEAILQKFTVMGEDIKINEDEFDYIYYTYGLSEYGNVPLIEPLEYKEVCKVKEFVIAIDTSASCRGAIVRRFLEKTYHLLKASESFFQKMNVHIIQCDNEIQRDTKITNDEDFKRFIEYEKLTGFGATDFRPVFEYVDQLLKQGEFENLKGLIYFTDGYGIYPERAPKYDVIFAFLEEDEHRQRVPHWSLEVILGEEYDEH